MTDGSTNSTRLNMENKNLTMKGDIQHINIQNREKFLKCQTRASLSILIVPIYLRSELKISNM